LAAISTNAIAVHAPPAAAATSSANDANRAPSDGSTFGAELTAANNQQTAPASTSANSSSANSNKSDAASSQSSDAANSSPQTASTSADATVPTNVTGAVQAQLQAEADVAGDVQDGAQPAGKPTPKGGKIANDNQASGQQASSTTQPSNAQPDPNLIAMTQASQITAPTQPQAVVNDEGDGEEETGAVGATGKPGTKSAPTAQGQSDTPASAVSDAEALSPVAAAQAAIRGTTNNDSSDNNSANGASGNPTGAVQQPVKTADNNTPQVQPQQTQLQQQPAQTPTPSIVVPAMAATANVMPVQTTSASNNVFGSLQVAPQTSAMPNLNSLAVEIAARSQSGAKEFAIRLDPPELGRVDVRLSIDATGKAEAHLTADQPETLNLLQKDSGTLTQALRDSGLDVSQGGLNFSLRGQNSQTGNDSGGQPRSPRSNLTASRVMDAAQTSSSISYTGSADQTRLDIHV